MVFTKKELQDMLQFCKDYGCIDMPVIEALEYWFITKKLSFIMKVKGETDPSRESIDYVVASFFGGNDVFIRGNQVEILDAFEGSGTCMYDMQEPYCNVVNVITLKEYNSIVSTVENAYCKAIMPDDEYYPEDECYGYDDGISYQEF